MRRMIDQIYEGRSASGQVLYLIRECIRKYEAEHGPIELPPEDEAEKK